MLHYYCGGVYGNHYFLRKVLCFDRTGRQTDFFKERLILYVPIVPVPRARLVNASALVEKEK